MTRADLAVYAIGVVTHGAAAAAGYRLGWLRGRWSVVVRWARWKRVDPEKLSADLYAVERWDA